MVACSFSTLRQIPTDRQLPPLPNKTYERQQMPEPVQSCVLLSQMHPADFVFLHIRSISTAYFISLRVAVPTHDLSICTRDVSIERGSHSVRTQHSCPHPRQLSVSEIPFVAIPCRHEPSQTLSGWQKSPTLFSVLVFCLHRLLLVTQPLDLNC